MLKLVKVLGVLAALFTTVDRASALSFTTSTTVVDYSITNTGVNTISGSIAFFTGLDTSGGSFTGIQTSPIFTLLTGQTFSEAVTGFMAGGSYHTVLFGGATHSPTSFAEAVPLPAGFPLFAMALIALGAFSYVGMRRKARDRIVTLAA